MSYQILSNHHLLTKYDLQGASSLSQLLQLISQNPRKGSRYKKDTCLFSSIYSFAQYKDYLFSFIMLSSFILLLSFSFQPLTTPLLAFSILQIRNPISYSTNRDIVQKSNRVQNNRPNTFHSSHHMSRKTCATPGS